MNAFELLRNDHRKVFDTFEKIESAENTAAKEAFFRELKDELEMHTHLEETILFPALKIEPETREITMEAILEHREVKEMLAELQPLSPDADEWENLIQELKEAVEYHIEEEESEMFDKARDVLSEDRINQLGTQMEKEKQRGLAAKTT